MYLSVARTRPVIRIKKASSVLRRSEQVSSLLPSCVLVSRHENSTALTRDNLNSIMIGVDSLDERVQRLASLACTDGHESASFLRWYQNTVPSNTVARAAPHSPPAGPSSHMLRLNDLNSSHRARFLVRRPARRRPTSLAGGPPALPAPTVALPHRLTRRRWGR